MSPKFERRRSRAAAASCWICIRYAPCRLGPAPASSRSVRKRRSASAVAAVIRVVRSQSPRERRGRDFGPSTTRSSRPLDLRHAVQSRWSEKNNHARRRLFRHCRGGCPKATTLILDTSRSSRLPGLSGQVIRRNRSSPARGWICPAAPSPRMPCFPFRRRRCDNGRCLTSVGRHHATGCVRSATRRSSRPRTHTESRMVVLREGGCSGTKGVGVHEGDRRTVPSRSSRMALLGGLIRRSTTSTASAVASSGDLPSPSHGVHDTR